jgi:HD-like signal output (HDOD) protein
MSTVTAHDTNAAAFAFVRSLASELSTGQVDLPSFPDVAMKMRQALDDESVSVERIARIAGAEAGLAARILVMANSPAMGYGGKAITELKTAVTKIGLSNVRTAALAFALNQLRRATLFKNIIPDLERLWRRSTQIAALSRIVADRSGSQDPDLAMLAGLLHNIGSVYILARAQTGTSALPDVEVRDMLVKEWSPSIGRSIAENWGLPDAVVEAIGEQADVEHTRRGPADLTDVLCLAILMADGPGTKVEDVPLAPIALARLGLQRSSWPEIITASDEDIAELQAALNG